MPLKNWLKCGRELYMQTCIHFNVYNCEHFEKCKQKGHTNVLEKAEETFVELR